MLKGTGKSDVTRRQKCSLAATKVKTTPTDDKTASMDNKTEPTDDKTKPMFGSSLGAWSRALKSAKAFGAGTRQLSRLTGVFLGKTQKL